MQTWDLDHKEGWVSKNWCFRIAVLEKILESPLYSKEIKPVNLKGNQPLTPAVPAFVSTNGIQVERTLQKCLTMAAPTKCFAVLPLEEAQKIWRLYVSWVPHCMNVNLPSSTGGLIKGCAGSWRTGMGQASAGVVTCRVGLERTHQACVAESWWLDRGGGWT